MFVSGVRVAQRDGLVTVSISLYKAFLLATCGMANGGTRFIPIYDAFVIGGLVIACKKCIMAFLGVSVELVLDIL